MTMKKSLILIAMIASIIAMEVYIHKDAYEFAFAAILFIGNCIMYTNKDE